MSREHFLSGTAKSIPGLQRIAPSFRKGSGDSLSRRTHSDTRSKSNGLALYQVGSNPFDIDGLLRIRYSNRRSSIELLQYCNAFT